MPMTVPQPEVWKAPELAANYLEGVRGAVPLAAEQMDVMVRLIAALAAPARRVLDLGCGNGILAAAILHRYPNAEAVLLDFSEAMLEAARQNPSLRTARVRYVLADFGDPAWVSAVAGWVPFDVVVSGLAIHHQPDERKRALYAEIHDLLAPGGLFLNVEHVSSPTPWVQAVFDELYVDSLYSLHERRGSTKTREQVAQEFYYRPDKAANILAPVDVQCRWLRDIGYRDVDCYFKILELAVFGGRR
jgi:SAM-dependent methyltransferase